MQVLQVKTLTNLVCATRAIGYVQYIISSVICTLTQKGQGICFGDSGGPLVAGGRLIGVASAVSGKGCGEGLPDIWTRVEDYVTWIKYNTDP